MTAFSSPQACLDDLELKFNDIAPELIAVFSQPTIAHSRKRVEEIVMQFEPNAEYYANLSHKWEIWGIRKGVLHVCWALAGKFSNTFFMYPPGEDGIRSEVQKLQEEIISLKKIMQKRAEIVLD